MGQERAVRFKRAPTKGFTAKDMLEAFKNWVPWTFMVPYTCFVVGLVFSREYGIMLLTRNSIRVDRLNSYAYMSLWLKAEKYTVDQINLIPTGGYALQIFMALIVRTCSTLRFFSHTNPSLIVLLGLRRYPTALANHSLCSPPPTNRKYHPVNLAKRQKRVVRRILSQFYYHWMWCDYVGMSRQLSGPYQ